MIIGLENIWKRFFTDGQRRLISFGTFKRRYLRELYLQEVIVKIPTAAGYSSCCEESVMVDWIRARFANKKGTGIPTSPP
ncbi:MAG: hypothetical protein ACHQYP_05895 [Nitrospiria bacterium]